MLNRSTTLKRTGFKSRAPPSISRDPDRVRATPTVTPGAFRVPGPVASAPAARVEKSAPVRSEALRRAVADMQPPKPKTGADNNREYLEMRKRDAAEQDRAHDQWLQRSDAADDERQREQRDETLMRQYEDCEDQKRIETLRNGYSSKRCQKP